MKYKLETLAIVVGLIALCVWALPARAAEPLFINYGGFQSLTSGAAENEDQQVRFELTPPAWKVYSHTYWNVPVDVKAAVTFEGTGFRNVESNPFAFLVSPQTWAEIDINEHLSTDIGVLHGSNGGGPTESVSWNRSFLRGNNELTLGNLAIHTSTMVFWVIDSENPEYVAARTIGDEGSKWGVEGTATITWPGYGSIVAKTAIDQYLAGLELDVLDGQWQPFAYLLNGDAILMSQPEDYTIALATGVRTEW